MISIRLSPEIDSPMENLAKCMGRTKTFHARETILEYLDDLEAVHLAGKGLQKSARTCSA